MSSGEGISDPADFVWASLTPLTDETGAQITDENEKKQKRVYVQFNPEKLDISLTNNFTQSSGDSPTQLVDEATAQLSLELQFDTTDTGVDVRQSTGDIAAFLKPLDVTMETQQKKQKPPPKVVVFEWGAIAFPGYIDSYSESLEFFSADGVPLRAKVSISMTQQERSFEPRSRDNPDTGEDEPFSTSGVNSDPFGGYSVDVPTAADQPLDNATAAANGIENPRLPGTDSISLPDAGSLGRGPAAFAEAGAAFGAGIGGGLSAGIGVGGGIGIGGGGGVGIGGDAGIGLSAGASAGIGLSAGFGASAGIGFGATSGAGFGASAGAGFGLSAGTGFGASASAGLGASVGAGFLAGTSSTATAFSGLSVKPPKLELKPVSVSSSLPAKTSTTGAVGLGGSVKTQVGASFSTKTGAKISFGAE